MSKVLKIASALILAAVLLVVGVALPGLAAPDETAPQTEDQPRPRMLRGVVASVDDENQGFFTIKDGDTTIFVNEGTKYLS